MKELWFYKIRLIVNVMKLKLRGIFTVRDHKGQVLTEELRAEYRVQQQLDEESVFDSCLN